MLKPDGYFRDSILWKSHSNAGVCLVCGIAGFHGIPDTSLPSQRLVERMVGAIAQRLNANERLEPDAHQLGAWCIDPERGFMFTGFIPAAAYTPGLSRALVYHLSAKNEWARALLFPSA